MNNLLFFISLIIISQAFSTATSKSKLTTFENIITEFVNLATLTNQPKASVGAVVADIKTALTDSYNSGKAAFSTINQNCEIGTQKINAFLAKLNADLSSDNANVNEAKKNLVKIAASSAENTRQQNKANKDLQDLEKSRESQNHLWEKTTIEAESKLNVIKRLRDLVTDELLNGPVAQPKVGKTALVQVNTFKTTLLELKEEMSKMEKLDSTLYTPLIESLLELTTEQNFADQTILNKILQVLKKLENNLKNWRAKSQKSNEAINKTLAAQEKALNEQLNAFKKLELSAAQEKRLNEEFLEHSQGQIEHVNAQKAKKTHELKNWTQLCVYEQNLARELAKQNAEANADVNKVATHLLNLN
jgi:chromosome segregation ATPase